MLIQAIDHFLKTLCTLSLNCLQKNRDVLSPFIEKFKYYDGLLNQWKNRNDKNAIHAGFEKRTITITNDLMFKLYLKDPQWIVKW